MTLLQRSFAGNELWIWLVALGVFALTFTLLKTAKWWGRRWLISRHERLPSEAVRLGSDLVRRTQLLFLFAVSLSAASLALDLPPTASHAVGILALIALLVQAATWGGRLITFWVNREIKHQLEEEKDAATATTLNAVGFLGKIVLWTVALLLALDNMGVDITALITGVGIAGIAIALALQTILGDLFASISIVVDKPFLVGDFIIVGDHLGTVERVGLKTTRIRSLLGEQLVFSNTELLRTPIRNFKRMFQRRIVFSFGIVYATPYDKLAAIPGMVREIIESQPNTRFDRAHFKEYGDFALKFEAVYFVLVPDFGVYMDIQQTVNLELYRRFSENGIQFAYPTQTVYLNYPDKGRAA